MRHIVLGCLLTLFSTTLFAQLKTDLALLNLKGPVKKWEMKITDLRNSSVLEHKITHFNPQGFKTKEEILDYSAQIKNFVYDEQGRLINVFGNDDDVVLEYSYRTNSDGTLTVIEKQKFKDSESRVISENTYDKNGLLIIKKEADDSCENECEKLENGMNKYSYHYDEHGNVVEFKNELFAVEPVKYANKYSDGKLIEQTEFSYGGKEVRTFDANGHQIQVEEFPPLGFGDGSKSSVKRWKKTIDNYSNVLKDEEFDEANEPSSTIVEHSYEYY